MMKRLLLFTLVLLTIIGCSSAQQPSGPSPENQGTTPTPDHIVPSWGTATIPVPDDNRPTVENPMIHLVITVTDADTGEPVSATSS